MRTRHGILARIGLYLWFRIRSKPISSVHSPMVFKLMQDIRKTASDHTTYQSIEELRKALHRTDGIISFADHGDGKQIKTRSVCSIARYSAKKEKYCLWLAAIVKFLKPKFGVELGTSLGISLAYHVMASPDTRFVSLEGSSEISELARRNLSSLRLKSEVRTGDFDDTLPPLLDEVGLVDYAFIDGHHQEAPTLRYFESLISKLSPEGCLVFDDIYWSRGMQNAWKQIIRDDRVSLSIDLFHLGIVFIRPGVEKQHFRLRV